MSFAKGTVIFDTFLILDFSARSAPSPARPTADAIWLGRQTRRGRGTATYHRTREAVFAELTRLLADEIARGRRVLLGVDFALGYPAGFARAAGLGGSGKPWRRVWRYLDRQITDGPDNANNRFAAAAGLNQRCSETLRKNSGVAIDDLWGGPFWGCPPTQAGPWLSPRRDRVSTDLPRRRLVEQRIASAHEVWKLYTTGSVGSQALLGIARLAKLRERPAMKEHLKVWPFETGFTSECFGVDQPGVVVAEVYPSLINDQAEALRASGPEVTVRDQAQVLALAAHFQQLDRAGRLAACFEAPTSLSSKDIKRCVDEEGWILGTPEG